MHWASNVKHTPRVCVYLLDLQYLNHNEENRYNNSRRLVATITRCIVDARAAKRVPPPPGSPLSRHAVLSFVCRVCLSDQTGRGKPSPPSPRGSPDRPPLPFRLALPERSPLAQKTGTQPRNPYIYRYIFLSSALGEVLKGRAGERASKQRADTEGAGGVAG